MQSPQQVVAGLQEQLNSQVAFNKTEFERLARLGIRFEPLAILHARIDALVRSVAELLGAQGPLWELSARIAFENLLAENIAKAEGQARTAQLQAGAGFTPGQIAEMARQSGVFKKPGE